MPGRTSTTGSGRLSRDDWLASALEALAKEGGSVLTIDNLTRRLGVSRGSFYWHFKDRTDFVRQLIDYWSVVYTQGIVEQTTKIDVSAEERLLALMEHIVRRRLDRYDFSIRAWASHDPATARMVKKVDKFRLDYLRALFAEMGFKGEELEMRTRTFVVYHSLQSGLFVGITRKEQIKQLRLRHVLLTRP